MSSSGRGWPHPECGLVQDSDRTEREALRDALARDLFVLGWDVCVEHPSGGSDGGAHLLARCAGGSGVVVAEPFVDRAEEAFEAAAVADEFRRRVGASQAWVATVEEGAADEVITRVYEMYDGRVDIATRDNVVLGMASSFHRGFYARRTKARERWREAVSEAEYREALIAGLDQLEGTLLHERTRKVSHG